MVDAHPGLYHDVQTYLRERIDEVLAGAAEPIVVRIFGAGPDDAAGARRTGCAGRCPDIDGLDDLHTELVADVPEIEVAREPERRRERYGLKPGDVRRAAAVLVSSEEVGDIFRGARAYDVHVWSTPEHAPQPDRHPQPADRHPERRPGAPRRRGHRARPADARTSSTARTPRAGSTSPPTRQRTAASARSSATSATGSTALTFPTGYHAELLGEAVEQEGAQNRLLIFGIAAGDRHPAAAAGGVRQHCAWRSLFFLTLPMALVGGVLTVYLTGGTLSLGSYVGFLAVFGIAARNGILLINHCQHLERHEGEAFGPALVLRGAKERLSPILMTALATALALVPLVIAGTIPGHEIEHPMALVIVGGLVTSTLRQPVHRARRCTCASRSRGQRRRDPRERAGGQRERRRSLSRMPRARAAVTSSRQSPTVAFGPTADTTPSPSPRSRRP